MSGEAPVSAPDNRSGIAERRSQVLARLDEIVDPCSAAIGHPIGLVGMGMIDGVEIAGADVSVMVLPTFPTCLFRGVFEEQIEERLKTLPWCERVTVTFASAERDWDERRMQPEARRALAEARRQRLEVRAP